MYAQVLTILGCAWLLFAASPDFCWSQSLEQTQSILEPAESADIKAEEPIFEETLPTPPPEVLDTTDRQSSPSDALRVDPPSTQSRQPADPSLPLDAVSDTHAGDFLSNGPRAELPLDAIPTQFGYGVLLQGPVHEAFAFPEQSRPWTSLPIVRSEPPNPILQQPSGRQSANAVWIEGYWAWFDDAQSFVWVSGLYRLAPPGRNWVAGTWMEVKGGFQWSPGYWADSKAIGSAIAFSPPAPKPETPAVSAPDEGFFWLSGQWIFGSDDYTWKNGYWSQQAEHFVWQPASYRKLSSGYVYVSGYWDYEPQLRGTPFASTIFIPELLTPGYRFRAVYPMAREATVLLHLFVRDNYAGYFYGDFYDQAFGEAGYRLWYSPAANSKSANTQQYFQWKYGRIGVGFLRAMERYENYFYYTPRGRPAAQLLQQPDLLAEYGLAGIVSANKFDDVVRGSVTEQIASPLARQAYKPPAPTMDARALGLQNARSATVEPRRSNATAGALGQSQQTNPPPIALSPRATVRSQNPGMAASPAQPPVSSLRDRLRASALSLMPPAVPPPLSGPLPFLRSLPGSPAFAPPIGPRSLLASPLLRGPIGGLRGRR